MGSSWKMNSTIDSWNRKKERKRGKKLEAKEARKKKKKENTKDQTKRPNDTRVVASTCRDSHLVSFSLYMMYEDLKPNRIARYFVLTN